MNKLINTDLDKDQLELANWIISESSEVRSFGDDKLLMFVSHYDLEEFFDLLRGFGGDYWDDGVIDLSYNGSDYVIDIWHILKSIGIDPQLIIDNHRDAES